MKLIEKVSWIIEESGMTAYSIAKETGEIVSTIAIYKSDPSKIGNMRLDRAERLGELFDRLQAKKNNQT